METFEFVMGLISKGVIAGGAIWTVWGLITFGTGLKDQTGPEIKQGIFTIVGGVLVTLGGVYLTTITM